MREFEQKKPQSNTTSTFFSPKIQKKLTTGSAGDRYEVEADKVADKVVNKRKGGGLLQSRGEEGVQKKSLSETISTVQKQDLAQEQPLQKKGKEKEEDKKVQKKSDKEEDKKVQKKGEKEEDKKTVQKKCADCEGEDKKVQKKGDKEEDKKVQKKGEKEEDKKVQKKGDKEEEKKPVQAKLNDARPVNNDVESDLNSSKGSGSAMDKNTKREMESGFGADFSKVTIHTDSKAVQMSEELGAQAFTHGNDVYFNKGKYNPDSKEGKHLLAHELTHTIQQTGAIQKSAINETHPDDLRAERPENPQYKGDPVLEKANDSQGNITFGHKGEAVQKIQTGLMDLGFQLPKFGADGDFGSETRNAVIDFQSHSEIGVDGIVGQQTMGTLDNALVELKGGDCCGEGFQLPQTGVFDIETDTNVDPTVGQNRTFCSKGDFKITSSANWNKKNSEKHYHIFILPEKNNIHKTNRRYDVGRSETQTFNTKPKTNECVFFKVLVKVINPKDGFRLKGNFRIFN